MTQELQRNYQALKQKAEPAPYFMAYEVYDIDSHEVGASLGVLNSTGNERNRYLDTTVRVGDQKLDNYRRVWGERIQFTSGLPVPVDDVPEALKARMWLETDRVYHAAADRLIRIKTNQQVKSSRPRSVERLLASGSLGALGKPLSGQLGPGTLVSGSARLVARFPRLSGSSFVQRYGFRAGR